VEVKGTVQTDKFGQKEILILFKNQNVKDIKEAINKYIQDAPDKEDDLIKRMSSLNDQFHEVWKQLNPS
jgi:hypothetical protein